MLSTSMIALSSRVRSAWHPIGAETRYGQFCSVSRRAVSLPWGMEDLEEAVGRHAEMMTRQEILQQYFRVFGKDMTQSERDAFFLPHRESVVSQRIRIDGGG